MTEHNTMITKMIKIVPYNPEWPRQFETEAKAIKQALGENCVTVHHVGSTSVPSLSAKSKIDIIAVVKEMSTVINNLEPLGYEYRGEFNIPFHFGMRKRIGTFVNLHVFEEGNPEIELNLAFRDYLRNHPEAISEYAKLKYDLLTQQSSHQKKGSMYTGYTLGKDNFIRKILQKTNFKKTRFLHCAHRDELKAAHLFRQEYFSYQQDFDPYFDTFNDPEHKHFVLNYDMKVVGYAHIQLGLEKNAIIHMAMIEQSYRNQGFGQQLLTLCKRWLNQQGIFTISIESLPMWL